MLLTGTWVCLFMSEKNDGNSPSLAIAIRIRGWKNKDNRDTQAEWIPISRKRNKEYSIHEFACWKYIYNRDKYKAVATNKKDTCS